MDEHLQDIFAFSLASCLRLHSDAPVAAVCKKFAQVAEVSAKTQLAIAMPSTAARTQLARLLGSNVTARECLLWERSAAKRSMQIEVLEQIRNTSRSMHTWVGGASITSGDVFAACKRAALLSENPATLSAEVELWMLHIVEAIETDIFDVSLPAWQSFAEQGLLDEGHTFWLLQLAHSLDALNLVVPVLKAYPTLLEHAATISGKLSKTPSMGRYSNHHCRLKDKDIQRVIQKAQTQGGSSDLSYPAGTQPPLLSEMLRSRRGHINS
jgi:hypothetical protein